MSHYTNCNTMQSIQVILWGDSFVLSFWNYLIRNASAGQWTGMGMNFYGWIWVLFGFQQYTNTRTHRPKCVLSWQDDEVVLQCVACIQKENRKFCLAAEGLGNRLCYLEPTSEAKVGTVTPRFDPLWAEHQKNAWQWRGMSLLSSLIKKFVFLLQLYNYIFSSFKERNWKKRCAHPAENSMETGHPYDSFVFRSRFSSACYQSWTNIHWILLMSFSCEGSGTDDNSLRWHPWMCLMDCVINSAMVSSNYPQLYCSWAAPL